MIAKWDAIEHLVLESVEPWRQSAYAAYQSLGLPHKKLDNWRYTPFNRLYANQMKTSAKARHFHNGHFSLDADVIQCHSGGVHIPSLALPKGVEVMALTDAIRQFPDRVMRYLKPKMHFDHGFQALNTAFFESGLWIYIPKETKLIKPLFIHHQVHPSEITHIRHLVVAEEHSALHLVEYFDAPESGCGFMNQRMDIVLEPYANCEHLKIQNMSLEAMLQSETYVSQASYSDFNSFLLQKGGAISTFDVTVDLNASYAKSAVNGVFTAKDHQFLQQRLNIKHLMPHCQSSQNFRGILDNQSKGVFIGQVDAARDAIKTEAHQSNKNLLLSKKAEMTTCPQLQIYADDVICSHGATVGQLDLDAIFYLQARGLNADYAKKLLIDGFIQEPLDLIRNGSLKAWCESQLDA
jgi:Fe-S cluster assembly protein SufD